MKTKKIFLILCLACFAIMSSAQEQVFKIWPGVAPGSEKLKYEETRTVSPVLGGAVVYRNVTEPSLTVFLPDPGTADGTAMIVAPGGGFQFLMWEKEGVDAAKWLSSKGVTVFVLRYRLLNTGTDEEFLKKSSADAIERKRIAENPSTGNQSVNNTPRDADTNATTEIVKLAVEDGRQAIRIVRQRAAEWKINPNRIGIMGFSAGGMVTCGTLSEHDYLSRPNFAGVIYGAGSDQSFPDDVPPVFIAVAGDDNIAAKGSVDLYNVLKKAGKEVELHVYAKGGHGFGMEKRNMPTDSWIELMWSWMGSLK